MLHGCEGRALLQNFEIEHEGGLMICPECKTELPDTAKFCNECGGRIEIVCPQCGNLNPPGSKFCSECGHNLGLPSEPLPGEPTVDEKFAKIQKYLPTGLAEKILSQRDKIEGERKQVTVMFCDTAACTPLVEKLAPEDSFPLIDQVFEMMIQEVHDFEGTVNELRGDGILALFEAPIANRDNAERQFVRPMVCSISSCEVEFPVNRSVVQEKSTQGPQGKRIDAFRGDSDGTYGW